MSTNRFEYRGIPGLAIQPEPHPCEPPDMRRPRTIQERHPLLPWRRVERTVLVAPFLTGVTFDCPVCKSHWHWSPPFAIADLDDPGTWYRHDSRDVFGKLIGGGRYED